MNSFYRHRAIKGSTRHSLRSFSRHLAKIGKPRYGRGIFAGKHPWYEVVIRGERGSLVLGGCSWGYYGEGSHGTEEVLTKLGVPKIQAEDIAFKADNSLSNTAHTLTKTVEVWRINLT